MKTFTLLFFFLISYCSMRAQLYKDGVLLESEFSGSYLSICAIDRGFNNCYATIDYGQQKPRIPFQLNAHFLTDKFGKKIRFYSPIGIMNFMENNAFEVFHISDSSSCILYRRKE